MKEINFTGDLITTQEVPTVKKVCTVPLPSLIRTSLK